jgi:4-hydroxyphenylpyruvate dioxygenase
MDTTLCHRGGHGRWYRYPTVEALRRNKVAFLDTPATYYELLDRRLPNHSKDVPRLQKNGVLFDGAPEGGLLLQIFTEN